MPQVEIDGHGYAVAREDQYLEERYNETGDLSLVAKTAAENAATAQLEFVDKSAVIAFGYEFNADGRWSNSGKTPEQLSDPNEVGGDRVFRVLEAEQRMATDSGISQAVVFSEDLGYGRSYIYLYNEKPDGVEALAIEYQGTTAELRRVQQLLAARSVQTELNSQPADFTKPLFYERQLELTDVLSAIDRSYASPDRRAAVSDYLQRVRSSVEDFPTVVRHQEALVQEFTQEFERQILANETVQQGLAAYVRGNVVRFYGEEPVTVPAETRPPAFVPAVPSAAAEVGETPAARIQATAAEAGDTPFRPRRTLRPAVGPRPLPSATETPFPLPAQPDGMSRNAPPVAEVRGRARREQPAPSVTLRPEIHLQPVPQVMRSETGVPSVPEPPVRRIRPDEIRQQLLRLFLPEQAGTDGRDSSGKPPERKTTVPSAERQLTEGYAEAAEILDTGIIEATAPAVLPDIPNVLRLVVLQPALVGGWLAAREQPLLPREPRQEDPVDAAVTDRAVPGSVRDSLLLVKEQVARHVQDIKMTVQERFWRPMVRLVTAWWPGNRQLQEQAHIPSTPIPDAVALPAATGEETVPEPSAFPAREIQVGVLTWLTEMTGAVNRMEPAELPAVASVLPDQDAGAFPEAAVTERWVALARIYQVLCLWVLLQDMTEQSGGGPVPAAGHSPDPEQAGALAADDEKVRPWLLLAIIRYLALVREQGMVQLPAGQVQPSAPSSGFPPQGVIAAFPVLSAA